MLNDKQGYLGVKTIYTRDSIELELDDRRFIIRYPEYIWRPLEETIKKSIVDHVAFMSTNYLPLVYGKKGMIYDTRLPLMDCFSFKSMMFDLPSSAVLDSKNTIDYLRSYFNLDFIFSSEEPIVWSKSFKPRNTAIISFTSGKESLLSLAICRELGLEPVLLYVVEPSNTYEHKHKIEILKNINREFGVQYYTIPHEVGLFHDPTYMGYNKTSLGWGNQLLYYMFIYLPFIFHHKARYLFFGNEYSCDKETCDSEGFRTNFCYDQSRHWTIQLDMALRLLTISSSRVGSLVGPLNEIAVFKCLHHGYPDLAKYQMSCFCDVPEAQNSRWCSSCSKCARNFAFMKAFGVDPMVLGFSRDMFSEECVKFFSALDGEETFGFDQSGLGRQEQELALYLAGEKTPDNEFLSEFMKRSRYNNSGDVVDRELLKIDYNFYFGVQDYSAIPKELKDEVYNIYSRILG
jgi:hypothetical protein